MLLNEIKNIKIDFSYHETLSPKIWNLDDNSLKSEVREKLLEIAKQFIKELNIYEDLDEKIDNDKLEKEYKKIIKNYIEDIIITGSYANFNYTKYSDLDLHIIFKCKEFSEKCGLVSTESFLRTKNKIWKDKHDINIYDIPVEAYIQTSCDELTGDAGIYSLLKDEWIRTPKKQKNINYDEKLVKSKFEKIVDEIEDTISSKNAKVEDIEKIEEKIRKMRKSGLSKEGELSLENIVFKNLRNQGYIEKLKDFKNKLIDDKLSI